MNLQRNYSVYMIKLNSLPLVCFYFHPISIDRSLCLLFPKLINNVCDTLADRNRCLDGKERRHFKLIVGKSNCTEKYVSFTYSMRFCSTQFILFFSHSIWNFCYCPWKSLSKLLINSNNKNWCRFKNSCKTTQLTAHKQKSDTLQKNFVCEWKKN